MKTPFHSLIQAIRRGVADEEIDDQASRAALVSQRQSTASAGRLARPRGSQTQEAKWAKRLVILVAPLYLACADQLIAHSESDWLVPFQNPALPSPVVNGLHGPSEYAGAWSRAAIIYSPWLAADPGRIHLLVRNGRLYVCVDTLARSSGTGPAYVALTFDIAHNGGSAPDGDDLRVTLTETGVSQVWRGRETGTYDVDESFTGILTRTGGQGDFAWVAEFSIPLSQLGGGEEGTSIGFQLEHHGVHVGLGIERNFNWPATSTVFAPRTWADLTWSRWPPPTGAAVEIDVARVTQGLDQDITAGVSYRLVSGRDTLVRCLLYGGEALRRVASAECDVHLREGFTRTFVGRFPVRGNPAPWVRPMRSRSFDGRPVFDCWVPAAALSTPGPYEFTYHVRLEDSLTSIVVEVGLWYFAPNTDLRVFLWPWGDPDHLSEANPPGNPARAWGSDLTAGVLGTMQELQRLTPVRDGVASIPWNGTRGDDGLRFFLHPFPYHCRDASTCDGRVRSWANESFQNYNARWARLERDSGIPRDRLDWGTLLEAFSRPGGGQSCWGRHRVAGSHFDGNPNGPSSFIVAQEIFHCLGLVQASSPNFDGAQSHSVNRFIPTRGGFDLVNTRNRRDYPSPLSVMFGSYFPSTHDQGAVMTEGREWNDLHEILRNMRRPDGTSDGTGGGQFGPLFRLAGLFHETGEFTFLHSERVDDLPFELSLDEPQGAFQLVFLDPNFSELHVLSFNMDFHATHGEIEDFALSLTTPLPPGSQRVEIRHQNQVLFSRNFSPNAPAVANLVASLDQANSQIVAQWSASDPDGDPLSCNVFFQPGPNEMPILLAGGLSHASFVVPIDLAPAAQQAQILVECSDGLNVTRAMSQPFALPHRPPFVRINHPRGNDVFVAGQPVMLEGLSYDSTAGLLPSQSLAWYSDQSGLLGTGSKLETMLAAGNQRLRLVGTAPSSLSVTDVVEVVVLTDIDADGLADETEVAHNLSAMDPSDAFLDPDLDGLLSIREIELGTDLRRADTDQDGVGDGDESQSGHLPLDPQDFPQPAALFLAVDKIELEGCPTEPRLLDVETASPDLSWTVSSGADWLVAIGGGQGSGQILLQADCQSLPPGRHHARVFLRPATGRANFFDVTLHLPSPVDFQQGANGYAGTEDTEIRFSNPDGAFGSRTSVVIDDILGTPAGPVQGLLKFANLFGLASNQIPLHATIHSAWLTLSSTQNNSDSPNTVSLHRMFLSWDELSSWNSLGDGIITDDVEAAKIPDAAFVPDFPNPGGSNTQSRIVDVTPSVRSWSQGGPNFGWVMISNGGNNYLFDSSESENTSLRPRLTVSFEPPEPVLICPSNLVASSTSPEGAVLTFTVVASNFCSMDVVLECDPPPGSLFPMGETLVTCTAYDDCGQQRICYFTVTVQEDPSGTSLHAFGLLHEAQGNATLARTPNGPLLVANVGSSNQDGVRVQLGEADFLWMHFSPFDPRTLPTGAHLRIVPHGRADEGKDRAFGEIILEDQGDHAALTADFSASGAAFNTVVAYAGDAIVAIANDILSQEPAFTVDHEIELQLDPCWKMPECWLILRFGPPGPPPTLTLPGGTMVQPDRVMIIPRGSHSADPTPEALLPVNYLTHMDIFAAGLMEFEIQSEQLGMFHHGHLALGDVRFLALDGRLDISNFGIGGLDGVGILPDGKNMLRVRWAFVELPPPSPGTLIRISADGAMTANGSFLDLGSLEVRANGNPTLDISADFGASDSRSNLVEIFQYGEFITSFHAENDLLASVSEWPSGGSMRGHSVDPGPWCLWLDWPHAVDFAGPFLPNIVRGTQLRVTPLGLQQQGPTAHRLRLQSSGFTRLELIDELSDWNGLLFAGHDHFALGNANLETRPATGDSNAVVLAVQNVGASGSDGVELDVAAAQSAGMTFDGLSVQSLPVGAGMNVEVIGSHEGIPGRTLASLTWRRDSDEMAFSGSFPAGAPGSVRILIFDGATQVGEGTTGNGGGSLTLAGPPPPWFVLPSHLFELAKWHFEIQCLHRRCWELLFVPALGNSKLEFLLPGQPAVQGDRVVIIPDGELASNRDFVERLRVSGSSLGEILVSEETLRVFRGSHTGLGKAELFAQGDRLRVANLGTTGRDGIEIGSGPARFVKLDFGGSLVPWPGLVAGDPSPQPNIRLDLFGSAGGDLDRHLGWVLGTETGNPVKRTRIETDLSPLGPSDLVMDLYRDGQSVGRFHSENGILTEVSEWPAAIGARAGDELSLLIEWANIVEVWPDPQSSEISIPADEVRISTTGPNLNHVDFVETLRLVTASFDEFDIVGEKVEPAVSLVLDSVHAEEGRLSFAIETKVGLLYTLERRAALSPQESWQPIASVFGDGSTRVIHQPLNVQTGQGFYRARVD